MKRTLVMFTMFCLLIYGSLAEADEHTAPKRTAKVDANFLWVPFGINYTRAALGADLAYQMPLFNKKGPLWQTTNITLGLREFYSFTSNSVGGFVDITPIAVFKLRILATYDYLLVDPFDGGVRVLTDMGRQRFEAGTVERGNLMAVDWVDGRDNRDVFSDPTGGGGLRLKIQPTLQAKIGAVAVRYTYTADFNFYSASDFDSDDIFYDPTTFTLRELRDRGAIHELLAVYQTQVGRGLLVAGATGQYYTVAGTDLSSLNVNGVLLYRPPWWGERLNPWFATQIGTYLDDSMHQYDFSLVAITGMDVPLF